MAPAKRSGASRPSSRRIDWVPIQLAYITRPDGASLRELAAEFGVSNDAISRRSKRERWVERREEFRREVAEEAQKKARKEEVERRTAESRQWRKKRARKIELLVNRAIREFKGGSGLVRGNLRQIAQLIELEGRLLGEFNADDGPGERELGDELRDLFASVGMEVAPGHGGGQEGGEAIDFAAVLEEGDREATELLEDRRGK